MISVSEAQELQRKQAEERERRVPLLVARFNGAIKYQPMLQDHPDWSDDECLAFARKHHAVAAERYAKGEKDWNRGIPYARNVWKDEK